MKNFNNEDIIDVLFISLKKLKTAEEILIIINCIQIILKLSENLIVSNGYKYKHESNPLIIKIKKYNYDS